MDSDESRHSECEFYYPEEKTLNHMTYEFLSQLKKKNKYVIYRAGSVRMGKKMWPWSRTQDLGHSFFPILTSRPINNIYLLYLSDSTRAVIGQFSGPYSTVRPAKFKKVSPCKMSLKENFETYLKEKYANEEKQQLTQKQTTQTFVLVS